MVTILFMIDLDEVGGVVVVSGGAVGVGDVCDPPKGISLVV